MKHAQDVIIRPVLTEKTYDFIPNKRYTFEVDKRANKTEIRQAVESAFGVKVESVNIVNCDGKFKRQGATHGFTPSVKKAYVTLKKDSKGIEFFDSMSQ